MLLSSDSLEPSSPTHTLETSDQFSDPDAEPVGMAPTLDDRLEAARADLLRRKAAAEAHALLAAADEATDPSELKHANAALFATLEPIAHARGVTPRPKPNAPPSPDRWGTYPPDGAAP